MASAPSPERAQAKVAPLLRLAWPIVVSRSAQVVIGLSDALMVAHLGGTALAATTTGAMNAFAFFNLPMGTVFIVSSFASQYFGKGDFAGARRYAWYGLAIAGITQLVAMASLPVLPWLIGRFDFAPELADQIDGYLEIRLLSTGAVVAIEALANYYGGLGNTRLPMRVSIGAMALNVAGNWVLINGHLGFPALGVRGAAWANVGSTLVACAAIVSIFLVQGHREGHAFPRLHADELWRTLRFGLPVGFNWFFEFAAFLFFTNVVVAGLGTIPLAAAMSVFQLNSVAFMPAFALASAGAIIVGQAIGAGARDEVPRAVRLTFLCAGSWQVFVGLVYLAIPRWVFAPFARGADAAALLDVGASLLMLSAAWQLFDAAATTLAESLRAAGDTAFTLWARMGLAWCVFAPGAWISVRLLGGGPVAAMAWMIVYLGGLALALWLRFRAGAWRRFDLAQAGSPA